MYNMSERRGKIAEPAKSDITQQNYISHNCIIQDHEKAYIMMTLDAQMGAVDVARGGDAAFT